jgi:hypothetical protein
MLNATYKHPKILIIISSLFSFFICSSVRFFVYFSSMLSPVVGRFRLYRLYGKEGGTIQTTQKE